MRCLQRWHVVLIEGILNFGLPMAAIFTLLDYVRSRYEPEHLFHLGMIPAYLVIFISGGIWTGYSSWNRLWDRKFDSPPGKIGPLRETLALERITQFLCRCSPSLLLR
jgi:hypothetical protein